MVTIAARGAGRRGCRGRARGGGGVSGDASRDCGRICLGMDPLVTRLSLIAPGLGQLVFMKLTI